MTSKEIGAESGNSQNASGKTEIENSALEHFDTFDVIVQYYDKNYKHKTVPADKGRKYRRIRGAPKQNNPGFHFEFNYYQKGGIGLELHDETENTVFEKHLENLDGKIRVNGFLAL